MPRKRANKASSAAKTISTEGSPDNRAPPQSAAGTASATVPKSNRSSKHATTTAATTRKEAVGGFTHTRTQGTANTVPTARTKAPASVADGPRPDADALRHYLQGSGPNSMTLVTPAQFTQITKGELEKVLAVLSRNGIIRKLSLVALRAKTALTDKQKGQFTTALEQALEQAKPVLKYNAPRRETLAAAAMAAVKMVDAEAATDCMLRACQLWMTADGNMSTLKTKLLAFWQDDRGSIPDEGDPAEVEAHIMQNMDTMISNTNPALVLNWKVKWNQALGHALLKAIHVPTATEMWARKHTKQPPGPLQAVFGDRIVSRDPLHDRFVTPTGGELIEVGGPEVECLHNQLDGGRVGIIAGESGSGKTMTAARVAARATLSGAPSLVFFARAESMFRKKRKPKVDRNTYVLDCIKKEILRQLGFPPSMVLKPSEGNTRVTVVIDEVGGYTEMVRGLCSAKVDVEAALKTALGVTSVQFICAGTGIDAPDRGWASVPEAFIQYNTKPFLWPHLRSALDIATSPMLKQMLVLLADSARVDLAWLRHLLENARFAALFAERLATVVIPKYDRPVMAQNNSQESASNTEPKEDHVDPIASSVASDDPSERSDLDDDPLASSVASDDPSEGSDLDDDPLANCVAPDDPSERSDLDDDPLASSVASDEVLANALHFLALQVLMRFFQLNGLSKVPKPELEIRNALRLMIDRIMPRKSSDVMRKLCGRYGITTCGSLASGSAKTGGGQPTKVKAGVTGNPRSRAPPKQAADSVPATPTGKTPEAKLRVSPAYCAMFLLLLNRGSPRELTPFGFELAIADYAAMCASFGDLRGSAKEAASRGVPLLRTIITGLGVKTATEACPLAKAGVAQSPIDYTTVTQVLTNTPAMTPGTTGCAGDDKYSFTVLADIESVLGEALSEYVPRKRIPLVLLNGPRASYADVLLFSLLKLVLLQCKTIDRDYDASRQSNGLSKATVDAEMNKMVPLCGFHKKGDPRYKAGEPLYNTLDCKGGTGECTRRQRTTEALIEKAAGVQFKTNDDSGDVLRAAAVVKRPSDVNFTVDFVVVYEGKAAPAMKEAANGEYHRDDVGGTELLVQYTKVDGSPFVVRYRYYVLDVTWRREQGRTGPLHDDEPLPPLYPVRR